MKNMLTERMRTIIKARMNLVFLFMFFYRQELYRKVPVPDPDLTQSENHNDYSAFHCSSLQNPYCSQIFDLLLDKGFGLEGQVIFRQRFQFIRIFLKLNFPLAHGSGG